jgi:TRAP-type C4-dicarboxylate transport system permease small subunit
MPGVTASIRAPAPNSGSPTSPADQLPHRRFYGDEILFLGIPIFFCVLASLIFVEIAWKVIEKRKSYSTLLRVRMETNSTTQLNQSRESRTALPLSIL